MIFTYSVENRNVYQKQINLFAKNKLKDNNVNRTIRIYTVTKYYRYFDSELIGNEISFFKPLFFASHLKFLYGFHFHASHKRLKIFCHMPNTLRKLIVIKGKMT